MKHVTLRYLSLGLVALIAVTVFAASRVLAAPPSSGCTPPAGSATAIVCTVDVGCPPGYIDRVGPAGWRLYESQNPMIPASAIKTVCTQPAPDQDTSASATATPTATPDTSASATPSATVASLAATTATPTVTPSATATATATETATPSATATPVASATAATSSTTSTSTPTGTSTVLVAQNATLGAILTDPQGMTLYTRSSDPAGGSSCTGACATSWPPFIASAGALTLPSGATGALATITRDDGTQQVTYNGKALYHYSKDAAPGDTNGQGVASVWFAATP